MPARAPHQYHVSPYELLEVECPSCRKRQDVMVWNRIDATADPGSKEDLITGRTNYFSCPSCGFEGFIAAPLFYDDPVCGVSALYVPVEYLNDDEYLERMFPYNGKARSGTDDSTTVAAGGIVRQDPHVVFSMEELVRYIIFRDRLRQVQEDRPAKE